MGDVYVIGDIHGYYEKLIEILQRERPFIDEMLHWCGGDSTLIFMGDYIDRGTNGIHCVNMIMRLQEEAETAGGRVIALLGNHEPFLLAAYRFGRRSLTSGRMMGLFADEWRAAGGIDADLDSLTWPHIKWMSSLPAMALVRDKLCIHADALIYPQYGRTVDEVNEAITGVLQGNDQRAWNQLIGQFIRRGVFNGPTGAERAAYMLRIFGGNQIVHGHTPIHYMSGETADSITRPLIYANELCVNVDHGLYLGGPGFVHHLLAAESPVTEDYEV